MSSYRNRRQASRQTTQQGFITLEVVGNLLPPEMVARIAHQQAETQTAESYSIPPGLKLRDEISRYYQIAQAHHERFLAVRDQTLAASETFVTSLLKDCFGFTDIRQQAPVHMGEHHFPVRHAARGGAVPIVIAPFAGEQAERRRSIDEPRDQFGDGHRKRSATQLLQEYLNADEDALWGLACDGQYLRLMRTNISLTRPAWIEVDLDTLLQPDGPFADFMALWLLIHHSRFGQADAAPSDCPLEHWREQGRIEGTAARDRLRNGVEAALVLLGQGFLSHPQNRDLRQALQQGSLTPQGYYEELLRLVYRLIFLFAAEDRGLLHDAQASDDARSAYRNGYSLDRLRQRCTRPAALDRHGDAWEGLRATFRALAKGEPRLALPALGGLFERNSLPHLENARLENRHLLQAIWRIAWFRPESDVLTRVNWRDMETEELGSVYESLLELTPQVSVEARRFTFVEGDVTRGNARKTSGSYYTPESLVKLLLDRTLTPLLDAAEARSPDDPAAAILHLSILDPACGSGHFLLGAARRAAERVAHHRSPGAPSREIYQHALREVVSNCIYGVDANPLAVELCRVALWIEALEPGRPLSFLDARIRCGDSLIGVQTYQQLQDGLPDEAFSAMTGDDKKVASALQRINRQERDGQASQGMLQEIGAPRELLSRSESVLAMPEDTLEQVQAKQQAFEKLHSQDSWISLKSACDLYVAAFYLPKAGELPDARSAHRLGYPTTESVWQAARGRNPDKHLAARAIDLAGQIRAFHWPLEFPAVMAHGGFDAVIGNPPWERLKLQEQEFFAARDAEIAKAQNKAERDRLIRKLQESDCDDPRQALYREFQAAKRASEAASSFARQSGRFPLTGTGDVNTYALFAELFDRLSWKAKGQGHAGMIVPTGIATDSTTSAFFGHLINTHRLSTLIDFENRQNLFPAVDSRLKFSILILGPADKAEFAFFLTDPQMLEEKERRFYLTPEQIARINPNTKTAPVFRSRADAELTAKLYDKAPVLIEDRPDDPRGPANSWGITFQRMFDMSNDSQYFLTAETLSNQGFERDGSTWHHADGRCYLPLYEAKMIHHYDHRWATYDSEDEETGARDVPLEAKQDPNYEPSPRYWVPKEEVELRAARVPSRLKSAWRKEDPDGCLKVLAEWLLGSVEGLDPASPARSADDAQNRISDILGRRALQPDVLGGRFPTWLGKVADRSLEMQRDMPLGQDDLTFLREGPEDPLDLTSALLDRKQPRWLMGWRDICRSTDERTVISSLIPKVGCGDKFLLIHSSLNIKYKLALICTMSSIVFDFISRQKIGGTSLKYYTMMQIAIPEPDSFSNEDLSFISSRVLELYFTAHTLRPLALDLDYTCPPFQFDPERRAVLRAELDAFIAQKYDLTRDELRYILDPADVRGSDYPSETFRVLKSNEMAKFGEYRTQRLVLEAFDRLTHTTFLDSPAPPASPEVKEAAVLQHVPDLAWERPSPSQPGATGAVLAAVLKATEGPMPIRQVRLATLFVLEPRLLVPLVSETKAREWRRCVGPEADPLADNVTAFVPHLDAEWGNAVRYYRGNDRLIEDRVNRTWAPGHGLEEIETTGWPDGRAGFVLEALREIDLHEAETSLPQDIQEWVGNVDAA
ncbi:MAG: Eco57I restriction-modification methylase domain-containing protein [Pseudomonadota bacterium]